LSSSNVVMTLFSFPLIWFPGHRRMGEGSLHR
jgi:hypothetical protein